MRALWSQIPRPRLGGPSSVSVNDPALAFLVRKTTTAPLKRRLTFNDAFTLLLTPVLATAFVVDTSWKEKQRRDWDTRLAEIQEEIDQFHAREVRILSSLRTQSVPVCLLQQRRHYSASADPQSRGEQDDGGEDENDAEAPHWLLDNSSYAEEIAPMDLQQKQILETLSDSERTVSSSENARSFSAQELSAAHRYHRLIATMLAIRLITHFHVATSARLTPEDDDMIFREGTKQTADVNDIPGLVGTNYKLRAELAELRRASLDLHGLGIAMDNQYRGSSLNMDLVALCEDFKENKLDPFEFVKGYGKLVLDSDEVPCTRTYVKILAALGSAGNESLAYYVNSALKNSLLPLTDSAVGHMLYHYGHTRDTQQADMFLRRVIQSGSPYNLLTKWRLYESKNGTIPVPENLSPQLLQLLTYMALRSNQPERAEIWCSFLEEINYATRAISHLFAHFLYHYALVKHWDKGLLWVQRGIDYAVTIALASPKGLSQVVFRMLDLCVACGRLPEYTTILNAAVSAGIQPPVVHTHRRQRYTTRAQSILMEWESLSATNETSEGLLPSDKAHKFQDRCRLHERDPPATPSYDHQAPADELGIERPTEMFVPYTVPSLVIGSSSKPAQAKGSNLGSVIEQQQMTIADLQTQIEIAQQALRPLQHDLALTKKRDATQKDRIRELENAHEGLSKRFDRLPQIHSAQKFVRAEMARLRAEITELKNAPKSESLPPLESMLTELATVRSEIAQLKKLKTPPKAQPQSSHKPLKNSPKTRPQRSQKPFGKKVATPKRRYWPFPNKAGTHHIRFPLVPPTQDSRRLTIFIPGKGHVPTPQETPTEIQPDEKPPSRLVARGDLREPSTHVEYRLDLSNIGHAIPDIKDSTPISRPGEDVNENIIDNRAVIRRYYEGREEES